MARHTDRTLTVQLEPFSGDNIRLDDFLEQMTTLKSALRETERIITGREPSLYFRIKELRKNSPALAVLEAVSDEERPDEGRHASYVVRAMTTNLRVIAKKQRLPNRINVRVLESYRDIATPAEKNRLEVQIQAGDHSVVVGRRFREILDLLVGEDEYSYGTISGTIEAINLHDQNRRFRLYPVIGPTHVNGTFRSKDRKRFAGAVDKYVTVSGRLKYKTWDKHPYEINADDITVHDEAVRPELEALKGMAPGATGNLTTQEFADGLSYDW